MSVRPLWIVTLVAIGALTLALHERETAGEMRAQLRAADSLLRTLAHRRDSIRTVVERDTLRLRQTITRYNVHHDSIEVALHDTARIRDTLVVREFVRAADSTIGACRLALRDCLALSAAQDSQITAERRRGRLAVSLAKPRRLQLAADLLYDPIRATPAIRAEATLHLLSGANLTTQVFVPVNEQPRLLAGVRWTF